MTSPTYGDPTQFSNPDLFATMLVLRDRIATADTMKDLDVALADFAVLRSEKERREQGGAIFVPMRDKFLAGDDLDFRKYGGEDLDDTPEPENSDEEPDQVVD